MGRRGDAYDNAPVESVISTIKNDSSITAASPRAVRPASPSSTTSRPSTTRAGSTARSATAHPTTTKGANSPNNPPPSRNQKVSTETGQAQQANAAAGSSTATATW